MKKFFIVAVIALITCLTYTVTAQQAGSVRGSYEVNIPEKFHKLVLDPLPAGTYSIGTGGYFPTIDSAFNKLSIDGIAGEVILELTDALYTAPSGGSFIFNGPITGTGPSSRVTIRPADNAAVTINGDGEAVLMFYNVSYLTIDGISPQGSTSLKVHAFYNAQGTSWNDAIDFYGDCDYVQVKNLTASSDDVNRFSGAVLFANDSQSKPDSGLISGVFIPVVNIGIYLMGNGTLNPTNFVISNNHIGSPSDSLIVNGIENEYADWTIIEENHIENMRKGFLNNGIYFVEGINSYISDNVIIRSNIIHNIAATAVPTRAQGIFISAGGQRGENNWIYNNMVYDIRSYVPTLHWLTGIFVDHNNPRVEYNTVWLSEVNDVPPTSGSSAIYVYPGTVTPIVRNNVLINTRNDEPYSSVAAMYYVADVSDYNDLYTGPFEHSYVGYAGGTFYKTLSDWQATGKDLNSITEMPNFIAPYLHIDETIATDLESHGTPINGIDADIDGDLRNAGSPDIGADEFNGFITPVELTSFTAVANGEDIILNWSTATEINNQGFNIERSRDNVSFKKTGFVPGFGTSTEPKNYSYSDRPVNNGTYYYRLKQIDYDGSSTYSNVVEIEWRTLNSYLLEQNYPNPFNPTTTIGFGLRERSNVKIIILNAIGEEVAMILDKEMESGYHHVDFDAVSLPSGVYFYQLKAGEFISTRKMILLK